LGIRNSLGGDRVSGAAWTSLPCEEISFHRFCGPMTSTAESDVPASYSDGMTTSKNSEPPASEAQIADAAVTWLKTQYPDLTSTDSAELHDRRLARVVRNYQAGDIPLTSVVDAVREWRTQIGDPTWLDGWDGELIRLIDRTPPVTDAEE
jgi:hypothetical protein